MAYSIKGVASFEGKAAAAAAVSARCASGVTGSTTTNASGEFAVDLGRLEADPFPCMLALNHGGAALHGYAKAPEPSHNITLLTELTLAKVLRTQPATTFGAFGTVVRSIAAAELADAPQFVESALQGISGYRSAVYTGFGTPDPFTSTQARADRDDLFNAVAAAMRITGVDLGTLRGLVAAEGDRRESFGQTVYKFVIEERGKPTDVAVTCNQPIPGGTPNALVCKLTGKRLTHPVLTPLFSGDAATNLGLSVSRGSKRVTPRADPTRPYQPAWCSAVAQNGTFKSTDTNGRASADPLGVFAEEITLNCGTIVDFEDELLAEVTLDDGNRAGPPGWPLVGASTSVTVALERSVIHSANFACDSAAIPPPFPGRGPFPVVTGSVSLVPGHMLIGLIARPGLPESTLINGRFPVDGDGVALLNVACTYGSPFNLKGACSLPGSRVPFENDVSPELRGTSLYGSWTELGIGGAGTTTNLEIHLFITDALGAVQQRLSRAVSCPGAALGSGS